MFKGQPAADAGQINLPLLIAKTVLLTLLMFAGVFGFFFFIWEQNPNASSSCFMLEILAVMYLYFNSAVLKGALQERFNPTMLKVVFILAMVIGVIQFVGVLSYAALAYMEKQDFRVEGKSYYIAIIPAAAGALIAPFLAYESKVAMAQFPTGPTGMVSFPG